jgi:hypothetical protein
MKSETPTAYRARRQVSSRHHRQILDTTVKFPSPLFGNRVKNFLAVLQMRNFSPKCAPQQRNHSAQPGEASRQRTRISKISSTLSES